jgi:long-chain acyl-CoA synthetase
VIIGDTLERNRRFYPDRMAVTDGRKRLSYREFVDRIFRLMNALFDLNMAKGDRIACLLSNVPEIMEVYFAVPFNGMVIVPLNYRLSPKELQFQLEESGARLLVVEKRFMDKVESIRSDLRGIKEFVLVGGGADNYLGYEDLLSKYSPEIPQGREVDEDDVALIVYTSGTTGKPKGAMLTHRNLLTQVYGFKGFSGRWAGDGSDVIMSSYPLFHVGVLGNFTGLVMGMQNVISNFDPKTIYDVLEKERITNWNTAPVMLEMMFANGIDSRKYDLSNVNYISAAGEPTRFSTVKKTFEVFPNPDLYYVTGLGLSETFGYVNFSHFTRRNLSRVERLIDTLPTGMGHIPAGMCGPIPHVDLKIVDDDGNEVAPGVVGEFVAKGDNVMKGYWNNPKATAETIKESWLHTGDLGVRHPDEPACQFVVGRKKEMILSGSENIYPAEVELAIRKHPSVDSVAVFGIPDEKWGETVKAAIILKAGAVVTEGEIIEFCRQHIASYKKPTSVYIVDDFPRSTTGKVLKKDLVRMTMEGKLRRG